MNSIVLDRPNRFDIFSARARAQGADEWEGYLDAGQVLTDKILKAVS